MKKDAKIYHLYLTTTTEILRVSIFLLLLALSMLGIVIHLFPNIFITPFLLFIIFEIYFSQKISNQNPKQTVTDNKGDIFESFTLDSLGVYEVNKDTKRFLINLLALPQVRFMISKLDSNNKEIAILDLDKKEIAKEAFNFAKSLNGKYVTTIDLFSAYLLLTESKTKLLFNKKIKIEDLQVIAIWANNSFPLEENKNIKRDGFAGEGFAEDWVYGWSIETQKYMVDLTSEFLQDGSTPSVRSEYDQLKEVLAKGQSAILVGEPGSGKESLVKMLAIESFNGQLSGNLYHQKVFQLMVDAFMAGAQTQGEIEERLNALMQELAHSGNIIVYIPEFQNLLGSQSFHLDLSGAITPYLKNGKVRIIAAMTNGSFKKFVEPMVSLLDQFSVINLMELSKDQSLDLILTKTFDIEIKHNVEISYRSVLAAIDYGQKYAREKVMPGAAISLLEDSANSVRLSGKKNVEESDILSQVKKQTHVEVGEPKQIEKNLLLNLEEEFHKRIVDQNEAVSVISEALRRLRAGLSIPSKPISFLFLGPTGVGKTETAKALADIYFGSKERFLRFDMSEFIGEDGIRKLLGSETENGLLTEAIFDSPYSLVLLDEFEKADSKILDLFLQVFDDGRLTDAKGKTVSFTNSIIIATSNGASEFIRENVDQGVGVDKGFKQKLLEFLQTKGIFKPELLNRFDDIVVFKPLGEAEVYEIVKLMLVKVSKNLLQKDIRVSFDTKVLEKIAKEGFDREFGARPLRRFIQDNVEDLIARKLLNDEIKRGDSLIISTDLLGSIVIGK